MLCLTEYKHYVNVSKCYSEFIGYFELVTWWNVLNFQDILLLIEDYLKTMKMVD